MKAAGIMRRVDELGRIVLPIEIRRALDIEEHDVLEVFRDGASIVLRRAEERCVFCGCERGLIAFHCKPVCAGCRQALSAEEED